ncbi:hypothetical protein L226DRAFT_610837 [Lentinus tigrinus ALCF2SS1-7]|uniref:Uncharacterized protein n=1 Tax=Lentinus tigrinus ALCF2SS1-6 TaxID=1328759 RepID=A0A5C2SFV0_9APHY|nr:hypothetical protein L227DRAFT_651592 [Lentinus tigrinus ALCF2SS1-6]RPD77563.1 hypothetical protein L226DRAFT_610837 [Lentinus tigrinus ALCF2SS1-7]
MSSTRRHDLINRANVTDESQAFKKAHQTVDRPPVTERDIHEQYMQDPPHNIPFEPNTDRKTRGAKEGAQEETDPKQDGVLGDEPTGKLSRQSALEEMTTESSIHPGNPSE